MCYDLSAFTKKIKEYEERFGATYGPHPTDPDPLYHISGFDHPQLPVITNREPDSIQLMQWGLIPFWVKSEEQSKKIWNRTLNARDNTLFEKPSFRDVAKRGKRCIIIADGFYDHHWHNGKSYPFFIRRKDNKPIALGGIWSTWRLSEEDVRYTCAIITTDPNDRMAFIHNKPAASDTPRMPFIIKKEDEYDWLTADLASEEVLDMIGPFDDDLLVDHTVGKLRGKAYIGNVAAVNAYVEYDELTNNQGSLF